MYFRRKLQIFVGTGILLIAIIIVLFVAVDLYYHEKYLTIAGYNHKGYKGKAVGRKQKDEIRIAVIGGSVAYGYGISYKDALPAQMENYLEQYTDRKVTVINLAYNVEGAYAFYYNLEDFYYLDYDYVLFYSGYLDLSPGRRVVERRSNPIFRLFGYMPIVPLITREKVILLRTDGKLDDAYRGKKVVFTPKVRDKVAIAVLENVLNTYEKAEAKIGELKKVKKLDFDVERLKEDEWAWYKHFMKKAVDFALEKDKKVIVVSPPFINEHHKSQQEALQAILPEEVLYVNMGKSMSMNDTELFYDGIHMSQKGSRIMGRLLGDKIKSFVLEPNRPEPIENGI